MLLINNYMILITRCVIIFFLLLNSKKNKILNNEEFNLFWITFLLFVFPKSVAIRTLTFCISFNEI
uniref:Uncharacterized protein n=1 Tax=Octopus bimaculoides TaxID=37653 RepID=A0A0L8HIJ8_OCTBM